MKAGYSYSSYVRPSTHVMRVGRLLPGDLTPLPDVVAPTLERLPADIGAQLRRDFWKRHGNNPDWDRKHSAQDWLATEVAAFDREKIHRAFDEEEIRALAQRWSDLCMRMARLESMQDFARSVGIEPPEVKRDVTRVGAARRLSCPRWWRRQIRKTYLRQAETHLRATGFVHRRRQVYASDRAVEHRRNRKARDCAMLQEMVAVSDAGDQLELWEVVQKSQANPALRRAELMARLRGFEEVAQAAGHVAEFVTLTCPSAYHRTHDNGTPNERWAGFSPRQGQQWLCKMWARARAKLARLSVFFYGFRVAEPHHDGTPHWHLVLFCKEALAETLREVLGGIWLKEYGDEPGALKYRTKFKRIDPHKGSACGYLAKYVAKNIDGHEVGDDHETEGQDARESCARVAAWASAHSVRQFQQLGGPGVGVWRELRRIRDVAGVVLPAQVEAARQAADAGQWSEFIAALGGIERGRRGNVALWVECTGELSQYDELRGPQVAGVQACAWSTRVERVYSDKRFRLLCKPVRFVESCEVTARIRTREKIWRIQRKGRSAEGSGEARGVQRAGDLDASRSVSFLGPVSITVRGSKTMPGEGRTGAPRSGSTRGSPWMH